MTNHSPSFTNPQSNFQSWYENIDELVFYKRSKAYQGSIITQSKEKRFQFPNPYDAIRTIVPYAFFLKHRNTFFQAGVSLLKDTVVDCIYFQPTESEKGNTIRNPAWRFTYAYPTERLTLQWMTVFHKDILRFLEAPDGTLEAIKQIVSCDVIGEDYIKLQLSADPEDVYTDGYAELHDKIVDLLDPSGRKMVRGRSDMIPDIPYTLS